VNASTSIRRKLEAGPWVADALIVKLAGEEVAELYRRPHGIEIVFSDGTPWGGGRKLNTALDTVACYLCTYTDPRSAAQRQADEDWQDEQNTIASLRH
jgi:hypothetical protein